MFDRKVTSDIQAKNERIIWTLGWAVFQDYVMPGSASKNVYL